MEWDDRKQNGTTCMSKFESIEGERDPGTGPTIICQPGKYPLHYHSDSTNLSDYQPSPSPPQSPP